MSVDTTTLTHTLGVPMVQQDWDALTLHRTITKPTNRGVYVRIHMVRTGTYMVTTA